MLVQNITKKWPQRHLHQHQLLDFFSQINHQSPLKLKPAGLCLLLNTNLTFLSSEHAAKLFPIMFLDSQISKKYACSCTKCTAFVKEALAPYFTKSLINNPFSLLIDQSNDRKNKACIILVRVLDPDIGYQDKILRYAYR